MTNIFWRIRALFAPCRHIEDSLDAAISAYREAIRLNPQDANAHSNLGLALKANGDKAAYIARWDEMNQVVHDVVGKFGGSISAEHGIGRLKRDLLAEVKSDVEMDLMRRIKAAFDPNCTLNPGRIL